MVAEGRLADDPADPGKRTVSGITAATALRHGISPVDSLTVLQWWDIYGTDYWRRVRASELPLRLALCVFDNAVNTGPPHAVSLLQRTVFTNQDGQFGPKTMLALEQALALHGEQQVETQFLDWAGQFYEQLAGQSPAMAQFLPGWQARVEHLRVYLDFITGVTAWTSS